MLIRWSGLIPAAFVMVAASQAAKDREVTGLVFLPDRQTLISGSLDGALHYWDAATGKEQRQVVAHTGGVYALGLSPDGQLLASAGADGKIRLWDAAKGEEIRTFTGHEKGVICLAFSPDGKQIASGGADKTIRVWSVADGKELSRIPNPGNIAFSLGFLPCGKGLVSGTVETLRVGGDNQLDQSQPVHLWNPETGKLLGTLPHRGKSVACTPDGRFLISSGDFFDITRNGNRVTYSATFDMHVWDRVRNRETARWHDSQYALVVSTDGRWLASGVGTALHTSGMNYASDANRGIQLRELATGVVVWQSRAEPEEAVVVALSPDKRRLVTGQRKGTIRLHDLAPKGWQAKRLATKDLEWTWEALAQEPAKAYEALWTLAGDAEAATPFLKAKLKRGDPAQARIRQFLADLASEQFSVREAADKGLRELSTEAEPELLRILREKPSLDLRTRVESILGTMPAVMAPDYLRQLRALEVLERIDSAQSREIIETLRGGPPGAWLTQQAARVLERLDRRSRQP